MLIRVLATLFVVFAVSRVLLRNRDGSIGILGTAVWSILWLFVLVVFWWPSLSQTVARFVGVGRGVDALVYFSIIALFYGIFRLYVKLEFLEHQLTSLTRNLALRDSKAPSSEPPNRSNNG